MPYQNATLTVKERVNDLMSRMTLEEKVAQMCQYVGIEHMRKTEEHFKGKVKENNDANGFYKNLSVDNLIKLTENGMVGSYLHVVTPEESNYLQTLALKSKLGIPLIIGIDAIHGNAMCAGATVYPTPIGQASSFDTDLVKKMSIQTAVEMRASGSQWTFTPNIDIARDPRWGRIGETFGEDPYLVSRMGVATILGFQGDNFSGTDKVLACAKHLIAGGQPINGTNASPMDVSEHTLREVHLPPYLAAIKEAKVFSIMAAHNELNGIPCHANSWIMNDIIRTEYKFDGFIVSDWMDIERMVSIHRYLSDVNEAYFESVQAGIDMHMHGPDFLESVVAHVKSGRLDPKRIDEACYKILESKFRLGLFENPLIDINVAKKTFFKKEHQQTALEAAEKSIVLLKNKGILPLDLAKYKNILVTGPNANSDALLGDWTLQQPAENVITVLEGLQEVFSKGSINFVEMNPNVQLTNTAKMNEAVEKAKKCDLAILVLGENPLRYDANKTSGENVDRMSLGLLGDQSELFSRLQATGIPVVVVLVGGRPLALPEIAEKATALVQAWEPGSFGGRAIANILTGKVNPSAKLPVSIPRSEGQIQMIYNHKKSQYYHPYIDGESTPLYPFGFGLSYTTFEYGNLEIEKSTYSKNELVNVSVNIKNSGKTIGTEVVQLYIQDIYSSPTRPVKELKDFCKVTLAPGETKKVEFAISPEKFAFFDKKMNFGIQSGEFEIMVGGSSVDKDLLKKTISYN
ncbi:MAG: beta-glucosidase [Paludibacter sp.]|nr:beta-glucosidase [Paludibacter sp.]